MHRQKYMHRVVSILTLSALSVHMLFGCCLHHAHELDALFESIGPAARTNYACSSHRHGHGDGSHHHDGQQDSGHQQDGQPDNDSQHQHCDGGTCVFMRADSVDGPGSSTIQNTLAIAVVSSCPTSSACFEVTDTRLVRLGVPIPIHLANQAFLL